MFTGLKTWAQALSWPIRIVAIAVLLFLLWTGWGIARNWWRPALPKAEQTVEQATLAEQNKLDLAKLSATVKATQRQVDALKALNIKLLADVARSGATIEKPLVEALASKEPKALAAVGNQWFVPGTAARLADESLRREPGP